MIDVVSAAIVRGGRMLMIQRAPKPGWPMLDYVFATPGGRVEPDEDHRTALERELGEELGLRARATDDVVYVSEVVPPLVASPVRVTCYLVPWSRVGPAGSVPTAGDGVVGFAWIHGPGLTVLELAPADAMGLRELQAELARSVSHTYAHAYHTWAAEADRRPRSSQAS